MSHKSPFRINGSGDLVETNSVNEMAELLIDLTGRLKDAMTSSDMFSSQRRTKLALAASLRWYAALGQFDVSGRLTSSRRCVGNGMRRAGKKGSGKILID